MSGVRSHVARTVCGHVTRRDTLRRRRWSTMTQSDVVGEGFAPVYRGVGYRDHRPCPRVCCCFAGEVPGVEFFEGGVDVVEVERDGGDDPLISVDLGDAEHLCAKSIGLLIAIQKTDAEKDKALPTGCDICPRHIRDKQVGDRSHVRDLGFPTDPDSRAHYPTAIVAEEVVGDYGRHGVPVACRKVLPIPLPHLACRVSQPRRRAAAADRTALAPRRGLPRRKARSG